MASITCRCGEKVKLPSEKRAYVKCGGCGASIRLRSLPHSETAYENDGFIRFFCSCGRRLKVRAQARPKVGKCPDCSRVVPVPVGKDGNSNLSIANADSETRTQDLDVLDLSELKKWSAKYLAEYGESENCLKQTRPATSILEVHKYNFGAIHGETLKSSVVKFETGLRICPQCKKPLHLGADNCRECGIFFPRQ